MNKQKKENFNSNAYEYFEIMITKEGDIEVQPMNNFNLPFLNKLFCGEEAKSKNIYCG